NSRTPPPDNAPWQPVKLPDNWYLSHPGNAQVGWYRLAFDLSPEQARIPHSTYLPRNSARRIDFWFNGNRNSANVAYGDPGARNWSPPMIHTLSALNLKPGRNVLHVRVVAVPEIRQGLTRVMIAQGSLGRPFYEVRYTTQITTLFMFGAAALLAGVLAAAFWLRERGDTTLLWFAITALAWAVTAFPWLHAVFTPAAFFHGPLAFTVRFAYAAPMLVLCLRVAGKRWPIGEATLWTFTLAGLALAWFLSEDGQGEVITYWSETYLAALFVLLIVLIRSQQRQRRWAFWLLAASLVLAVLLNAHDLAWWMGWIDYESFQLAHFHIPLVLFAIGATIIDRHFQAVAAVERAKLELEGRVAEKAREIEANYARVQEAEHEKALARERQRIMADMHDGLGSSLVGLLGAVQSGRASLPEVERRLHDALQELRLAVDALEPIDGDLGVILGNVRHRMRTAIESSGVRFHWQVGELPQFSSLTPKAVLDIQRIVLEALTNSLHHARARDVTVGTQVNGSWLQIGVSDDGIGFDESSTTPGRGLESLRQRARRLGGTVEVRSSPGAGTSVTLRLPLEHP
ncbi:MAG TPA: sensor histidine kinase, partial [Burkholderiales bacterium]|nr:sensor histidine kinase [Burkholderiales bacterium]